MVSLSNHEGVARAAVRPASWFDGLTMKRLKHHTASSGAFSAVVPGTMMPPRSPISTLP